MPLLAVLATIFVTFFSVCAEPPKTPVLPPGKIFEDQMVNYAKRGPVELAKVYYMHTYLSRLEDAEAGGRGLLYPIVRRSEEWHDLQNFIFRNGLKSVESQIKELGPGISVGDIVEIATKRGGGTSREAAIKALEVGIRIDGKYADAKAAALATSQHAQVMNGDEGQLRRVTGEVSEKFRKHSAAAAVFEASGQNQAIGASPTLSNAENAKRIAAQLEKLAVQNGAGKTQAHQDAAKAQRLAADSLRRMAEAWERGSLISEDEIKKVAKIVTDSLMDRTKGALRDINAAKPMEEQSVGARELRTMEREAYSLAFSTLGNGLALLGEGGRKAGLLLNGMGQTTLGLLSAIDKANQLIANQSHFAGNLMMGAAGIGAVLSIGNLIASLFGPDMMTIMLEEIRELRKQVEVLRKEMHERFDLVHEHLNAVHASLSGQLTELRANDVVNYDGMVSTLTQLRGLGDQLALTVGATQALIGALAEREGPGGRAKVLMDGRAPLTADGFAQGMDIVFRCTHHDAFDAIALGGTDFPSTERAIWEYLPRILREPKLRGVSSATANLKAFFEGARVLGKAELPDTGSPLVFANCVQIYLRAMLARRDFYHKYSEVKGAPSSYHLEEMVKAGEKIQESFDKLNPDLFEKLIKEHRAALDEVGAVYPSANGRQRFLHDTLGCAHTEGLPFSSLQGIDPWLPANKQTPANLAKLEWSAPIEKCADTTFEFQPASQAQAKLAPAGVVNYLLKEHTEYVTAHMLRLGVLKLCYTNVNWVDRNERPPNPATEALEKFDKIVSGKAALTIRATFVRGEAQQTLFERRLVADDYVEVGIYKDVLGFGFRTQKVWQFSNGIKSWEPFPFIKNTKYPVPNDESSSYLMKKMAELWHEKKFGEKFAEKSKPFDPNNDEKPVFELPFKELIQELGEVLGKKRTEIDAVKAASAAAAAKALEKDLNHSLLLARGCLQEKTLDLIENGGKGSLDTLKAQGDRLESMRVLLENLLSLKFPNSISQDPNLARLFHGRFALPDRRFALDVFYRTEVHTNDEVALRKSLAEAEVKLAATKENSPERAEAERAQSLERWRLFVGQSWNELYGLIKPVLDDPGLSRVGLTPADTALLKNVEQQKGITYHQLMLANYALFYKAVFLERLDKPNYVKERHPLIDEWVKHLNRFIKAFPELTKPRLNP